MTIIEKLRALARDLAGDAWDYDRRRLPAQAHVRREAARAVMTQADATQHEDEIFEDPLPRCGRPVRVPATRTTIPTSR